MTAKEMFESLGYKHNTYCEEKNIEYVKVLNDKYYGIDFCIYDNPRFIGVKIMMDREMTIDEFKAIQQQMKELGWIDD